MREDGRVDLVGTLRDGNGLQPREVRFTVSGHRCSGGRTGSSFSFSVTWPNGKFDCRASRAPGSSPDNHIRASARSAKMPPPFGTFARTTIAFHFLPATPTP